MHLLLLCDPDLGGLEHRLQNDLESHNLSAMLTGRGKGDTLSQFDMDSIFHSNSKLNKIVHLVLKIGGDQQFERIQREMKKFAEGKNVTIQTMVLNSDTYSEVRKLLLSEGAISRDSGMGDPSLNDRDIVSSISTMENQSRCVR